MQESKIDDSELVMVEIRVTLGMGTLFLIYGIVYFMDERKYGLGITAIINSALVAIQCYLMYKFYIQSKKGVDDQNEINEKNKNKKEWMNAQYG